MIAMPEETAAAVFEPLRSRLGHGMHWIGLGLPPANHSSKGSEDDLNRLGFSLGAAAQSNVDQGPDLAPPASDLATARHLGRRVAEVMLQVVRGRAAVERSSAARANASA